MIHFFAAYPDIIENFVDAWARQLKREIRAVPYRKILFRKSFPPGICIFSDLELLSSGQAFFIQKLNRRLKKSPVNHKILNEPNRCLRRFDLLKTLHERGINHFRAYRPDELKDDLKFPVFLRREADHRGALTPLLHSRGELDEALRKLSFRDRWLRRHRLMAVEYVDCMDHEGIFRKFSVMNVNGTLIPRHILFSRNWMTKKADLVTPATVEEEVAFIENFPHREQVAEIFRIAGIDYGRIDYGLKGGSVQVWEINTNPTVVPHPDTIDQRRLPVQSRSAAQIARALEVLGENNFPGGGIASRAESR